MLRRVSRLFDISIHAPHTGRDCVRIGLHQRRIGISIHAPHTGRDVRSGGNTKWKSDFNPRAPYGARHIYPIGLSSLTHFNPRAPYGARLPSYQPMCLYDAISIHAPHTGRDTTREMPRTRGNVFQSTRPIRGATIKGKITDIESVISIHAPHTGRDHNRTKTDTEELYISIHAPHTGRDVEAYAERRLYDISIHAPHTGRDVLDCQFNWVGRKISIHAPHTGRDSRRRFDSIRYPKFQSTRPIRGATIFIPIFRFHSQYFNPRAPYGARRLGNSLQVVFMNFNPRAPYGARRPSVQSWYILRHDFNPRAPYGARPNQVDRAGDVSHFNPRAPYGARQQKCIIYVLHFCNNRQSKHKNQQETSSVRTFF